MLGEGVVPVSLEIVAFASTNREVYALQVGAFSVGPNADKVRQTLEAAGFYVTIEKTPLNVARVLVRGIPAAALPDTRRKLESLGFLQYLLRKEKTEDPAVANARRLNPPAAPAAAAAVTASAPIAPQLVSQTAAPRSSP